MNPTKSRCIACGKPFTYHLQTVRAVRLRQRCPVCSDRRIKKWHRAYDKRPDQLERRRVYMAERHVDKSS